MALGPLQARVVALTRAASSVMSLGKVALGSERKSVLGVESGESTSRNSLDWKSLGGTNLGESRFGGNCAADRKWLPDMDLNHDKQIQSLLCYRYTIGQCGEQLKPRNQTP